MRPDLLTYGTSPTPKLIPKMRENEVSEKLCCLKVVRNIDNAQPLFSGVIHGICRSSGTSCQVADTGSAVIHQMAIPPVHAVRCIFPGRIHNLIASALDILINCNILTAPSSGLILTRQYQNQAQLRVFFFHIQNRLRRKSIEPPCASGSVKHNPSLDLFLNHSA